MHPAAAEYIRMHLPDWYASVLEIGSLDINGGIRCLLRPSTDYLGIDVQKGPGVDLVADFADYRHPYQVDLVICCEVFEHTPRWPDLIASAALNLRQGCMFLLTCATQGRAPHSARNEAPIGADEYYRNVLEADLRVELAKHFAEFETEVRGTDLRAFAVKASHA